MSVDEKPLDALIREAQAKRHSHFAGGLDMGDPKCFICKWIDETMRTAVRWSAEHLREERNRNIMVEMLADELEREAGT